MAHWTDGPEYAPTERPDVFVEPEATPLADQAPPAAGEATAAPTPPAGAPPEFTPPDAAPPLDALEPPAPATRDPREAFDVAATPMTSWTPRAELPPPDGAPVPLAPPPVAPTASAWGAAHVPQGPGRPQAAPSPWAPDQPFPEARPAAPSSIPGPPPAWPPTHVNPGGFPPVEPPPWQQPPQRQFEPVTIGAMLRNATPGVLISLGIAALVPPLALALLVVASVLAARIRYRRQLVGRLFSWAILVSFVLGLTAVLGSFGGFDLGTWYDAASGWAQLGSLLLLVTVPLVVGDAMRRGEPPEGS